MNFFERVEDFLSEKLNITKENKSTFLTLAFIVFVLLSFVIFVSPIKVFGLLIARIEFYATIIVARSAQP